MAEYKNYITSCTSSKDKSTNNKNLVLFCHFDKEGKIHNHVIHYVKELNKNLGSDVYFVSNCESLDKDETKKISSYTKQIITRKNAGYDFAAYQTGFLEAKNKENYKNIIFCNDSVYGPFYSLKNFLSDFNNSRNDVFGITDNIYRNYHIQSYFIAFKSNEKSLKFLNNFFKNLDYLENKKDIVTEYEIGLSKKLTEEGFTLTALCSHYDSLYLETKNEAQDNIIKKLADNKKRFTKKKKRGIFNCKNDFQSNKKEFFGSQICEPHISSWYTSIKYQKNPFIKVLLVNNPNYFYVHNFYYASTIKELYPEFDMNLIFNHSHKNRYLTKK